MSALDEYLNNETIQPELYDDDGWKLLDNARSELKRFKMLVSEAIGLTASLDNVVSEDESLSSKVIALIRERDTARAELAALRARCEKAEAELQAAHVYLDESLVNSSDDYENIELSLADRIAGVVQQLYECRALNVIEHDATHMLIGRVESLSAQLQVYQRREALRQ